MIVMERISYHWRSLQCQLCPTSRPILNYFELRMWKIHLARFLNLDNLNFSSFFSLCAFLVLWIFQQQDGVKGTARQYDRCVRIKDDANLAYKIQMETLINPWLDVIRLQREWMMLGKTVNMLKKRWGDAFYNCTEKLLIHFITLAKFTENTLK